MEVPMVEINETNYCNQKSITMDISFAEHDLINDALNYALSAYEFIGYMDLHELPEDSETLKKYESILAMKERFHVEWMRRFDNPPYDNN